MALNYTRIVIETYHFWIASIVLVTLYLVAMVTCVRPGKHFAHMRQRIENDLLVSMVTRYVCLVHVFTVT